MRSAAPSDIITENAEPHEIPILAREQIVAALDIAVLKPDARLEDVTAAARVVEDMGAASLCVASYNVAVAKSITPRVCSVIGFPHGNTSPEIKFQEARAAIEDGATELDVVINYGRFLEGREIAVVQELGRIVQLARRLNVKVKAVLETGYYQPRQITEACGLCLDAQVDWVKTSTGFGPGGATPWAVQLMVEAVKGAAQVKASGGIKTYEDACLYLALGCTRLGVGVASYKGLLP
jgi:deoxyribose-phosphate aldolase